jgi:hypothetical protein
MELLELVWNSFGTPIFVSISLSLNKIYIYIVEEFQEFQNARIKVDEKFTFDFFKKVPIFQINEFGTLGTRRFFRA